MQAEQATLRATDVRAVKVCEFARSFMFIPPSEPPSNGVTLVPSSIRHMIVQSYATLATKNTRMGVNALWATIKILGVANRS